MSPSTERTAYLALLLVFFVFMFILGRMTGTYMLKENKASTVSKVNQLEVCDTLCYNAGREGAAHISRQDGGLTDLCVCQDLVTFPIPGIEEYE